MKGCFYMSEFIVYTDGVYHVANESITEADVYAALYAYEATGRTPEEVEKLMHGSMVVMNEYNKIKASYSELEAECEGLREKLRLAEETESKSKAMQEELENLKELKDKYSEELKNLDNLKDKCSDLEKELAQVKSESKIKCNMLQTKLNDAKRYVEILRDIEVSNDTRVVVKIMREAKLNVSVMNQLIDKMGKEE